MDTTLVSPVRADAGDSVPPETGLLSTRHAAPRSADTLLTSEHGRARLVVLAFETGGRWSEEAHDFLGATLLVLTLVHSIVMLCCAGVRHVIAGAPWRFGGDGEVPTISDVVWSDLFSS